MVTNDRVIGQWMTIKGEHSLTWGGIAFQDNTGGWINLLPAGKTLTLSGNRFRESHGRAGKLSTFGRFLSFDGTGKTIITGASKTSTTTPGTQRLRRVT